MKITMDMRMSQFKGSLGIVESKPSILQMIKLRPQRGLMTFPEQQGSLRAVVGKKLNSWPTLSTNAG